MRDVTHKHFKNVEISRIFRRIDTVSFVNEIQIELRVKLKKDDYMSEQHEVTFEKSDLRKLLKDFDVLEIDPKYRIYLAFGMQDIDFWRDKNKYMLTHSPYDGMYFMFVLKKTDINKLKKALNNVINYESEKK